MTDVSPQSRSPFIITLGLDLTDTVSSGFAFDEAARIASRIAQSQVHVVYVVDPATSPAVANEAAGLLRHYVSAKWDALSQTSDQVFGIHVRRGEAACEIAQLASDVHADMIIVGNHKVPHLKTMFLGSTAERVMATTTCPVFVAGPRPRPTPSHVIVIEPPCPDCVTRRTATAGKKWWCERHSERHLMGHRHVYSYQSDIPFAEPDMAVSVARLD